MTPIVFDFVISITAVVVGLYVLVWKLNAYTLKKYTPLLGSMIIIIGMLAWSVFALASYSAMHQSPAWVFVEGIYGSWGYSAGRGIFFFNWLLLIYYIVNTVAFWVIAVNIIATEKEPHKNWREFLSVATVQKIFSPPLLGFIIAVIIVLFKIPLPEAVLQTCKHLGSMTTPLSMLFIGIAISRIKLTWSYFDKDIFLALGARFLLAPILVIGLHQLWPVPNTLMFKVFVIQAAMPVMTQSAIIAKYYNVDAEYAAMLTTVSTLLAMLVIPFYMWLFATVMHI